MLLAAFPVSAVIQEIPAACPTSESGQLEGTIAFVSDQDGDQQIYLMNVDGSDLMRLTNLEGGDLSDLDWSPDGRFLAFVNHDEIYMLELERLTIRQLTNHPGADYSPDWSPDGTRIAYITTRSGPYDIWVMTAAGANIHPLTSDPRWEMTVGWVPNGTGFAYVPNSGTNLEIVLEGTSPNLPEGTWLLFEGINYPEPVLHTVTDINWSPSGERIALQTDYGAYLINVDGTGLYQVEERETYAYGAAPSWSPEGCWLAYTSRRNENSEIYIFSTESMVSERLTTTTFNQTSPAWRPKS